MSNLAFVTITGDDYVDLETVAGVTLTTSKAYTLQIIGQCVICEAASKPSKGGFYITDTKPFQWTKTDKLWVLPLTKTLINIAE